MEKIIEIAEKVSFHWENETKSIVAAWKHFFIDETDFQNAISVVINHARINKAKAWIVDASGAKSTFKQELFAQIRSNTIPKLKELGISYYLTITPKDNAFAKATENKYREEIKKTGIQNIEFEDVASAIDWLKINKDK